MGKKRTEQITVGNTPLTVDFKRLQKQKSWVYNKVLQLDRMEPAGLLEFLDAFQDASAEVLGERIVFGKGKS